MSAESEKTKTPRAYFAGYAPAELSALISSLGVIPAPLGPFGGADEATGAHADMQMCRLGNAPDSPLVRAKKPLPTDYPACAAYNALAAGGLFIHRLDCTAPELLAAAEKLSLRLVNVRQGYAKCAAAVVSDTAVITADRGIARALKGSAEVLLISPGHVVLPGYEYGFIGGACGTVGGKLVFCGDLSSHPDAGAIRRFAEENGREVLDIEGFPLTDVGSIIESVY